MLISKVPDNEGGKGEGQEVPDEDNDSHEYQTANELFELMAKNQNFDTSDVEKLTTRDLVLLYKNIDLGTKLMSNANEFKRKKPNQHVESIVHDEPESDSSDTSDIYSNEDLQNVFLVNNERIDLLNTPPSVENTLCHKLGDLEIQSSNLTTEYEKHFLFKDPYIEEQLKSLKLRTHPAEIEGTVLPASLLDYVCCKRLEDNYNFYMDNIIRYVKHTIEQLKRISNGDYLTDKAKEKWREVENAAEDPRHSNTKVLATSTSIPLHVERKIGGRKSTWDDLVHSAVDIRSLSKILEKKIVVEVPKLICGSYKLLSKCCADNLIISCKKEQRPVEEPNGESRVDVVFQLQRSETGQVMSNISSIMILQTAPAIQCDIARITDIPVPLPLPYIELSKENRSEEKHAKIIELEPKDTDEHLKDKSHDSDCSERNNEDNFLDSIDFVGSDNDGTASLKNSSCQESSESSDALRDILDRKIICTQREVSCEAVYPDDLRLTIQKLTMQSALTEESGEDMSQSTAIRKKSPTRVRIKSPYENQSFIMEEKKRRKLLEIRERRERKKIALAENCKITKHRYGKGAIMPQSASSVTKLSITNKSFYNSIYGQSTNVNAKQTKERNRKGKREVLDVALVGLEGEHDVSISTPEKNSKKYINRSYYLDDAVTEMMYMNMKQSENEGKGLCSASTSVISNDFRNNLNLLSQLIGPSDTDLNIPDDECSSDDKTEPFITARVIEKKDECVPKVSKNVLNTVPSNSPILEEPNDNDESKKFSSSIECRKSIDKIYTLMKKYGKSQDGDSKSSKGKLYVTNNIDDQGGRDSSTFQGSDSGTSLKHRLTSSNPSCFSFEKNNPEVLKPGHIYNQKPGIPINVVPKVIISSKSSSLTQKNEADKNKKERRKSVTSPTLRASENPLKAISHLLHEIENVHKTRQKSVPEQKPVKKSDMVSSDGKSGSKQSFFKRRSRLEQHNETQNDRGVRITTPKEKKNKSFPMDIPKIPYQQIPVDEKHIDKMPKKKIVEMLDEVKEARGEAVRGPSKLNSRLHSLAQPKRSYVQAHSEEYQTKYGKNLMADRLQRLAAAPPTSAPDRNSGSANSRNKIKRSGTEAVSTVSMKLPLPAVPPLERAARTRHSASSSPEIKERLSQGVGSSCKHITVPETPKTLKKKMVAVESYVKNYFGRATSTPVVIEPQQSAQKSRAPFVPTDIDLVSLTSSPTFEESTELGSRLHHIINTIIKTNSGLEVLTECHESNSKRSKEESDDYSIAENMSRSEHVSSDSDYTADILDDKNVLTTVEKNDEASKKEQKNINEADENKYDLEPFKSVTELEKLENALCRRISVGTFPKRLRIKNLTLTPKQSMQKVLLLQSGDVGSLVVKTPITQSVTDTKQDNFPDLNTLPGLSKSQLDWSFANFPMQISTVGYAFPEYKSIKCGSTSRVHILDKVSTSSEEKSSQYSDKEIQCFKGAQSPLRIEQAAQVDVPASTLVSIGISSTHIIDEEKDKEIKQNDTTNNEPKRVFIDFSEDNTIDGPLKDDGKIQTKVLNEKNESSVVAENPENIEYSTSLDILVGLLNEIQKITTCQTQITNADENQNGNQESKELETILNKAAALENSVISSPGDVISFTSLDKLRQLESTPSIYSFYLSNNDGSEVANSKITYNPEIVPLNIEELSCAKPVYADKEVNVDLIERGERVNKFTEVPSQIFPVSINHSTKMTSSLIGVLSEPSTQSIFSFAEYHSVYSNTSSIDQKSIIEVPQIIISRESNESLAFCEVNQAIVKSNETNPCVKGKIQSFGKTRFQKRENVIKGKYCLKSSDFDPLMKMKRDVLVTVYSILVFTVFAALSFPEMLYRY